MDKELLEALKLSLEALRSITRQIPNDERLADWDFSLAEISESKTIALLEKHGILTDKSTIK